MQFNGVEVEKIYKDTDGKYYYDDPANTPPKTPVPNSEEIYADIGLGLKISDSAQVDSRTAFQVSFSGLEILGFGEPITGKDGTPNVASNIYDLLTQLQNSITPPLKKTETDDALRHLLSMTDQVGMMRTDLGTRMNFLERTKSGLEADIENMTGLETDLISSDPAQEAIKMKECEYSWLAILQLGSKVLPSSLLDFMN